MKTEFPNSGCLKIDVSIIMATILAISCAIIVGENSAHAEIIPLLDCYQTQSIPIINNSITNSKITYNYDTPETKNSQSIKNIGDISGDFICSVHNLGKKSDNVHTYEVGDFAFNSDVRILSEKKLEIAQMVNSAKIYEQSNVTKNARNIAEVTYADTSFEDKTSSNLLPSYELL
jgi:hypothetical protein